MHTISILCCLAAGLPAICTAQAINALPIRPADPSSRTLIIGPGEWLRADGSRLAIAETRLGVDAPELRTAEARGKTPGNYTPQSDSSEFWSKETAALSLCPARDEEGTRILGGLYRAIVPGSVKVLSGDGSKLFARDVDYKLLADWGKVASIEGRLGTPGAGEIAVSYQYATQRIDLVQIDAAGNLGLKRGAAVMVCPELPQPDAGAEGVAGVYVAPWLHAEGAGITQELILPIRPVAPAEPINAAAIAPAVARLQAGEELKIAFMGDSVTLGAEAGPWWADLWTEKNRGYASRVVVALRQQYPKATVTGIPAFRGGITTQAASPFMETAVLPSGAQLVIIAFGLNDADGPTGGAPNNPPEQYKEHVRALIRQAKSSNIAVLLVAPMQPNPFMKNGIGERIVKYRDALAQLASEENVACADVYSQWMNQSASGVPPYSQLHNWINHPGPRGHALYAQTILRVFAAARQPAPSSTTAP